MHSLKCCLFLACACLSTQVLADNQPPSIPNGITLTAVGDSSVRISWNGAWDDVGVDGYNIYRNGSYFVTVFGTTSHLDTSVTYGNDYRYSLVAFDQARNYSSVSSESVIQVGSSSTAPPTPQGVANNQPDNLSANILNGNQIELTWSAGGSDVAGYNIYRDNAYHGTSLSNSYRDNWLDWGRDYRYEVVAFTSDRQFSDKSEPLVVNTANPGDSGSNNPPAAVQPQTNSNNGDRSNFVPDGYQLVFNDEFRGWNIDSSKWNTQYRWGPNWIINGERQYYVDTLNNPDFGHSPFEFDGEHMTISAIRTPEHLRGSANWQQYLSGALTTYNKFRMRYGYVEMRARFPRGRGLWSAFWLLHQHDNDRRPEIDVVEHIGHQPTVAYHTYHYYENWNLRSTPSFEAWGPDYSADFHTYGMKWEPGRILWFIDGVERARFENGNVSWEEMYLLVNLAVGGWWPGDPDGSTSFPARYTIDYIRAYQQ
ncbi:MAG: family 16 glycosylhydrolase [Gammaproteobacteria bacterium]|nr:family 16 glycosylhydrolase [Gammaproteobacteria bacterium]